MGTDREYSWETEFSCESESDCDNEIEIKYWIREYPEGAFNDDKIDVTGGEVVERFEYDFSERPDEDEDYKDDGH